MKARTACWRSTNLAVGLVFGAVVSALGYERNLEKFPFCPGASYLFRPIRAKIEVTTGAGDRRRCG